jgi:hypothetical protein
MAQSGPPCGRAADSDGFIAGAQRLRASAFFLPYSGATKDHQTREAIMATVAVIFGGMLGFVSALVSLIAFDASWLFALSLWAMAGFAVALVLIAMAMMPQRATKELDPEHA